MIIPPLFIDHGFMIEFIVTTVMFTYRLKYRNYPFFRILTAIVLLIGISFLWTFLPFQNPITETIRYVNYFLALLLAICFVFDVKLSRALFSLVGAAATQHAAFKIGEMVNYLTASMVSDFVHSLFYLTSTIVVYSIVFFAYARRMKDIDSRYIENHTVTMLSVVLIVFVTLFQKVFEMFLSDFTWPTYVLVSTYDLMCCFFILSIQSGMFRKAILHQDNQILNHLIHQQKIQFESSKETIELVNIRCHDLKRQISLLDSRLSNEEKEELRELTSIYDTTLKTGNDVLDVILTENSLICRSKNIKLNCMVDGRLLAFMGPSDIYALFGNAIDNAVEAVEKVADIEKRVISFSSRQVGNLISLHFENYFEGDILLDNDLPKTTKNERNFHGFGLKSIRLITDKYDGYFSIQTINQTFVLNVILPLPTIKDVA